MEPDEQANLLGIEIVEQKLRTADGLWIPEERRIILKAGLARIDRRCVLQHEVIHAMAGHGPHAHLMLPEERWTRQETARTLVDPDQLNDLIHWRPDNPERWCRELRINPEVLRDFLAMNKEKEL